MRMRLAAALALGLATAAAAEPLTTELWPQGPPFPFAELLAGLEAQGARPEAVLVPVGRSLQRFAADPDYWTSPRVVVAVTEDAQAAEAPRLADRLFLGYQPAAESVEVIAYDEQAGRFEFLEIHDYAEGREPWIAPAERSICLRCHQHGGPIFARPLWSETNANPRVADRLAALGERFHGAPVRQTVDAAERIDRSTDRGSAIAAAQALWREGCPDPACRAALLAEALRFALTGVPVAPDAPALRRLAETAAARWPDGISAPSPDIANFDPVLHGLNGPADSTPPDLDPEAPRPGTALWPLGAPLPSGVAAVAALLTEADAERLDKALRARPAEARLWSMPCETRDIAGERRFRCAGPEGAAEGFLRPDGTGRLRSLRLGDAPPRAHVELPGRFRTAAGDRVARAMLSGDGARLSGRIERDFAALAEALAARADHPAFGDGPFRRRAALAATAAALTAGGPPDG